MTTGIKGATGTTTAASVVAADDRPSARTMVRRLMMAGCTPTEAANLAGLAVGLRPVPSGWSIREIERLRFLRHLVASGRLPA